ncbi:MAG: CBS domain-containing protein, partial [Hyphomicrobiaceae bacterium]|nr:CBS domain-containing protein [Hyphomicrobiaceae bacterium]
GARREATSASSPWPLAALPPGDPLADLSRVDSFSYVHRVCDVMSTPPVWVEPDLPVADAVALMMERRISSLFVDFADGKPGIVTERDMLRMIDKRGAAGLDARVREAASRPLLTVGHDDFVYRAIGRMERLGVRHLAATSSGGEVTGMVTARNLLRYRATAALVLGDAVEQANDERELGRAWAMVPSAARALRAEGVGARDVAKVISAEICAITRRAAAIAEQRMVSAGRGGAPARHAVLVLGSAGRGESLIAADQDNAIVFEASEPGQGEPDGAADT